MKIIDYIFKKFGYAKVNSTVTFTMTKAQFIGLIQSRGKFNTDQPGIAEFDVLLNALSEQFGYTNDWALTYNEINHPAYALEKSLLLDMSNVKRAEYKTEILQGKVSTTPDIIEKLREETLSL